MTHPSAKIRRQFDRSASGLYDRSAGVQRFMAAQLAGMIRDELVGTHAAPLARIPAANLPVLEIGCGTGLLTERLAALLPPGGRLTAADLSPAMLEAAKSRLYARGGRNGQGSGACPRDADTPVAAAALAGLPPDAVRFLQADAEEWAAGAPSSSCGLIASSACFQWFVRPAQTLVHLRRLLKPHGKLAAATFGPDTFTETAPFF
ncbi:methyltransferase domain-containing protein [Paenibacillus sp. 1P03SA]|uniref:methyltransferase domain-containing protein n=1 Tax=Paenibacillus sp. 1P03SA TaxID=3132294 RepID=UPI0039A11609